MSMNPLDISLYHRDVESLGSEQVSGQKSNLIDAASWRLFPMHWRTSLKAVIRSRASKPLAFWSFVLTLTLAT